MELLSADAAGIVLGDARRELRAVAASDEAAHIMELLQLQSDEGPCLDCFQTAAPVSVADLTEAAGRWPTFVAAVAERGDFRSVHALPLRLRGRAIGALNLFGNVPGPLPELDLALGQALADVATIGRVARGISAPGSHRSRRNSLRSPGSCHPDHQTAGAEAVHSQCANIRGYRWTIPRQHRNAFFFARSRLYLLRIQRIK